MLTTKEEQANFVKQTRENSRLSVRDFASKLGVSGSYISQVENKKSALSPEIKEMILQVYKDFTNVKQNFENGLSDFVELPVKSNITASMGYGVDVIEENQTSTYAFSKKLLSDIGANPKCSDVIFSAGDSMYPTIEGGDCLVVDRSKTEIYDGKIYCVRIDNQLYAKRLQKIPPQTIKVISDNNDKYDPFYIDLSQDTNFDFTVIGEVKWWSRVAR